MVLHDMNQAIRYSDRLIVMKSGQLFMEGAPHDIMTESMIKSVYGVDVIVKHDQDAGLYMVPIGI